MPLPAAKLGDAGLATQAVQNDADQGAGTFCFETVSLECMTPRAHVRNRAVADVLPDE